MSNKATTFENLERYHRVQTKRYQKMVEDLYKKVIYDVARDVSNYGIDYTKDFYFDDYPELKTQVLKRITTLNNRVVAKIQEGEKNEWKDANEKNDAILKTFLYVSNLPKEKEVAYFARNNEALEAFQNRRIGNYKLSGNVWEIGKDFYKQLELSLSGSLHEGQSAANLGRELVKYQNRPTRVYLNKDGSLRVSKLSKLAHPGRGVYKSATKNAIRLTGTEINMAYRESDRLRWDANEYIVGYEVRLSNNHTCKDGKGGLIKDWKDICDKLVGRYPKWFIWKGWHPNCRCYAVPIFMSDAEMEKRLIDKYVNKVKSKDLISGSYINDVPKNFKDWIEKNAERSENWTTQPYFIQDNFKYGFIRNGLKGQ